MVVSLNWLKEYVDLDKKITVKEIVDRLTMTGTKVEKYEKFGEKTQKVYTARVDNIKVHPEDEKLYIIDLNFGDSKCSAVAKIPDIEVGDIVPVAIPGAKVIGKEIKVGLVKGIKSNCMICHILDLGLDPKTFPWVKPSGLISFPKDVELGKDINEILGLGDYIIEFEITPNRPDCMSVEGIARELAVTFNKPYKTLWQDIEPKFNKVEKLQKLSIKVESKNCNRYIMNVANDVNVKESPYNMQLKLIKCGIRPINNIVDITNYVMLELGQPLHAFDYDKVDEKIIVRQAKDDERVTTLDGANYNLNSDDLVISDSNKAIALAGIMGGQNSMIDSKTHNIAIESANFVRGCIRNTSRKIKLRTDASNIYEKGIACDLTIHALNRVCDLLNKTNSAKVNYDAIDIYQNYQKQNEIKLDYDKINRVIGENISKEDIKRYLNSLSIKVVNDVAYAPYFRVDLDIIEDIAEEVVRLYGYDRLKSTLPKASQTFGKKTYEQKAEDNLKNLARACGYNEIYTYTFFSKDLLDRMNVEKTSPLRDCIKVLNPLSQDFEYMRTTAMPLMLEALEKNYTKKNTTVKLFELGKIFLGSQNILKHELAEEELMYTFGAYDSENNLDYYDIKADIENILNYFRIFENDVDISRYNETSEYHPGMSAKITVGKDVIAVFGKLSPIVQKNYILPENTYIGWIDFDMILKYAKKKLYFVELPKYPVVERDIAFVIEDDIASFDIINTIKNADKSVIESVELFDVYQGKQIEKGKKSMAYRIRLRSKEKTLKDQDITEIMNKIVKSLEDKYMIEIRK